MQRQVFLKDAQIKYISFLGKGGFGEVHKATWDGTVVAVKQISPDKLSKETSEAIEALEDFVKEAWVHSQLKHPQIIQLYGLVADPCLGMVMEFMENGSLTSVLRKHSREEFGWPKRYSIAKDIGNGVSYLHKNKIIHRDLKSQNILLDINYKPKIADFGLARIIQESESQNPTTKLRGSSQWMAPELFVQEKAVFNEMTDVYSFGMTLWELLSHEFPYKNIASHAIAFQVVKGTRETFPKDTPQLYKKLTERCWSSVPKIRPAVSEIINELEEMLKNSENEKMLPLQRVANVNNKVEDPDNKKIKDDFSKPIIILDIPDCINPFKGNASVMTQNYKGYIFPCDEMFKWVIEAVEKTLMQDAQLKTLVISQVICQEHLDALILYCLSQKYPFQRGSNDLEIKFEKYKDDYSVTDISKKSKPMTAFKEMLKEKNFIGEVLLKLYVSKYHDYNEACYQVGCHLSDDNALLYLQRAGSNGYAKAFCKLAECFEKGDKGVEKNIEKAIKCYQAAANYGDEYAIDILETYKLQQKEKNITKPILNQNARQPMANINRRNNYNQKVEISEKKNIPVPVNPPQCLTNTSNTSKTPNKLPDPIQQPENINGNIDISNQNQNQPIEVPINNKTNNDDNKIILQIPDDINPIFIFAKSFCLYTKGQICNQIEARAIFEKNIIGYSCETISIDMKAEDIALKLKRNYEIKRIIALDEIIKKNDLTDLAKFLIKGYKKAMTQNYKGYTFPSDEMFEWVIEMIEKSVTKTKIKRLVLTHPFCREQIEAMKLYCETQGYRCMLDPQFSYALISNDKYKDDNDSIVGLFTKSKPMTAFKEMLAEKDLAGKALLKVFQIEYGDYHEACYQVGCHLSGAYNALKYLQVAGNNRHTKALCKLAECCEVGDKGAKKDIQQAIEYYQMAAQYGDKDAINKLEKTYKKKPANIIGTPVNFYQPRKSISNENKRELINTDIRRSKFTVARTDNST